MKVIAILAVITLVLFVSGCTTTETISEGTQGEGISEGEVGVVVTGDNDQVTSIDSELSDIDSLDEDVDLTELDDISNLSLDW